MVQSEPDPERNVHFLDQAQGAIAFSLSWSERGGYLLPVPTSAKVVWPKHGLRVAVCQPLSRLSLPSPTSNHRAVLGVTATYWGILSCSGKEIEPLGLGSV